MSFLSSVIKPFFLAVCLFFSGSIFANDAAHEWLSRINNASRTLNYEGVFVYQYGSQLETMRIVHKVVNGSHQERLVSLNGAAREIIRNDRKVVCYLPDKDSVVVEHRKTEAKSFPAILPTRLRGLDDNYEIRLGKQGRVVGRQVQRIIIKPRDGYRYGYQLWADRETGLLLKADLMDSKGKIIEQFMFTNINVGAAIPSSALEPQSDKDMIWYRDDEYQAPKSLKHRLTATRLPKGFKLSMQTIRKVPMRNKTAEHFVYSDGLAAVSVFVENQEKGAKIGILGPSRMGAVNAFGTRVNGHQVTVVGQVPAKTVALIGNSVVVER
ncbi:MAG: MucB/RseB C-terminal domain-containing protein [Gammaproteobacteria bacterium]|nr:MAG: MucB/RseB C-terminal domain-containing protein [Gammaproteobacteria bacterium]